MTNACSVNGRLRRGGVSRCPTDRVAGAAPSSFENKRIKRGSPLKGFRWALPLVSLGVLAAAPPSPLAPIRSIVGEPRQGWADVAWSEDLAGWIVAGRSGLSLLRSGAGLVPVAGPGEDLAAPTKIGAGSGELVVFDGETESLTTFDTSGRKVRPAISAADLGGLPFGCLAWNGKAWVVTGRLRRSGEGRGTALTEIQVRERATLRFVGGSALLPEEKDTLRSLIEYGACASNAAGRTIVSFWGIPRLVIIGPRGEIEESIPLPIPVGQRVDVGLGGRSPRSPENYDSIYRGKTVPFAVGWSGDSPSVLLAKLGGGLNALRWVTLTSGGQVRRSVSLGIESHDGRDFFAASFVRLGVEERLLVLSAPYSGPAARGRRTLHEFRLQGQE